MIHTPRKRFGQHFLKDKGVIQRIVQALHPQVGDHLIEIGPGQGALSFPVLAHIDQLEAIEFDRDLVEGLQQDDRGLGKLIIYSADVLNFDFSEAKKDERSLRIFGNLPYNISTPLIFHLLDFAALISDMLFMVQKEVAERLAAPINIKSYGRLTVMMQYHCKIEKLFDVPAEAFNPPPKVCSSVIRLLPYHPLPFPAKDYSLFEQMVKLAFNQRRKTLRNSLRELISDEEWERIPNLSHLRAENLSVQDFVALANEVKK